MTTVETIAFAIFEGCAFLAVDFSVLQTPLLKKNCQPSPTTKLYFDGAASSLRKRAALLYRMSRFCSVVR